MLGRDVVGLGSALGFGYLEKVLRTEYHTLGVNVLSPKPRSIIDNARSCCYIWIGYSRLYLSLSYVNLGL